MDLLKQMGQRLLQRRKQFGFSQEELAERVGVTSQMISSAERGKKAMRPENIIRICAALEMSTDYLLTGAPGDRELQARSTRLALLSPEQFRCLETIVDSFVSAVTQDGKTMKSDPLEG